MIKYALACAAGHEFESWFRDSAAFDMQARRGLIACPACNSIRISKAIMSPALGKGLRRAAASESVEAAPQAVALLDARQQKLREMMRALRKEIVANADDVGTKFPEEARRIHDGDSAPRSIYGQASLEDARALLEEGIDVMPMPVLPDERN